MTKEFYEKVIDAAKAAIDESGKADAVPGLQVSNFGISGNVTIPLNFDANGNASYNYTKRCVGITVSLSAYIDSCPADSRFDIHLHTDYSQDFSWGGVAPGAVISQNIKTNFWTSTTITVTVHSNHPNSSATMHLHYST